MARGGRVGLIAGGPPCQGYSLAGRRSRHDRRNSLFLHYIELVAIVRPHLLLIENVKGIAVEFRKGASGRRSADSRSAPYSEIIAAALNDIGYDVQAGIVHSVDCGVAQKRPRFIMAGLDRTAVRARRPDIFKIFQKERLRFLKRRGLPRDRFVGTREAISDLETKGRPLHACPDSLGHVEARYRGPQTPYSMALSMVWHPTASDLQTTAPIWSGGSSGFWRRAGREWCCRMPTEGGCESASTRWSPYTRADHRTRLLRCQMTCFTTPNHASCPCANARDCRAFQIGSSLVGST
jgi:site-specific DNA-cytosine methylase